MKCGRCSTDTYVEPHQVDGRRGYLCPECREVWERLTDSATGRAGEQSLDCSGVGSSDK